MQRLAAFLALAVQALASPNALPGRETTAPAPIRRTISFKGVEREYFPYLPGGFDRSRTYWPFVVDAACRAEHGAEFDKYSRRTVDFFRDVVRR